MSTLLHNRRLTAIGTAVILQASYPAVGTFVQGRVEMKAIADKGKIRIGGGFISLVKPVVKDKGKIKIGGGFISLIKPIKK
jgi:hypothetical protein